MWSLPSAPGEHPKNVYCNQGGQKAIDVSWEAPPEDSWNGQPLGYLIFYMVCKSFFNHAVFPQVRKFRILFLTKVSFQRLIGFLGWFQEPNWKYWLWPVINCFFSCLWSIIGQTINLHHILNKFSLMLSPNFYNCFQMLFKRIMMFDFE